MRRLCGHGRAVARVLGSWGGVIRKEAKQKSDRNYLLRCEGAHSPEMLPELIAYLSTIVRVSQEFIGLAWVRYDVGFKQQGATRSQRWSVVNLLLYASCFTG